MCHSRDQTEVMNPKFRKDCGTFIMRTVWACAVGVWIRWWDVANMIQSRGVLCYPLWWLWVSMLLMNANIDDDILWLRAVVVRTFHHTGCVSLCGRCLDPVMGCREYDPNLGVSIMMNMNISVFDDLLLWCEAMIMRAPYVDDVCVSIKWLTVFNVMITSTTPKQGFINHTINERYTLILQIVANTTPPRLIRICDLPSTDPGTYLTGSYD